MAAVRPISELKENFNDISSICNDHGEVIITRDGSSAYVLMTMDAYEEQKVRLELYKKLEEADIQIQSGIGLLTHEEVFGKLIEKYGHKKVATKLSMRHKQTMI